DHVHLLIRKHRDSAEEMIEKIQALSRKRLVEVGLRELEHPTWTRGGWKVFLDHPDDVKRTIRYLEDNPVKTRLPRQQGEFVTLYDNCPLHGGHSPDSPYARALRAREGIRAKPQAAYSWFRSVDARWESSIVSRLRRDRYTSARKS